MNIENLIGKLFRKSEARRVADLGEPDVSQSQNVGLSPGTPVYIGAPTNAPVKMHLYSFNQETVVSRDIGLAEIAGLSGEMKKEFTHWLNIDGLHDIALLQKLGETFGIHSLVIEDIANTQQRPKFESYEGYYFIVIKMIRYVGGGKLQMEQLCIILKDNLVITLQEDEGDVFDTLRDRIVKGGGRLRRMNAAYTAYAIMDMVVDHYFLVLEEFDYRLESLEEMASGADAEESFTHVIQHVKRELLEIRRHVWPLREVVNRLQHEEDSPFAKRELSPYLKDLYDHTIQVVDSVETFRDIISGILDIHLSNMSHRLNKVMKVLTIISTIFIPLTFLAGVYGMNFETFPEIRWKYGYLMFWIINLSVAFSLLIFFRRRKWL